MSVKWEFPGSFFLGAMLVLSPAKGMECSGSKWERNGRWRCLYVHTLSLRSPEHLYCQQGVLGKMAESKEKIRIGEEELHRLQAEMRVNQDQLNLVEGNMTRLKENLLKKERHVKSLDKALLPYELYLRRGEEKIREMSLFQPLFLRFIPDLFLELKNYFFSHQMAIEELIAEVEKELVETAPTDYGRKMELHYKLKFLTEAGIFTDQARKAYPGEDRPEAVSKYLGSVLEGKEEDLSKNINPSSLKLIEMAVKAGGPEMADKRDLWVKMMTSEEKEQWTMKNEERRLYQERAVLEEELVQERKNLQSLEGERKVALQRENEKREKRQNVIRGEIAEFQKALLQDEARLAQCREDHSECVWKMKSCSTDRH